MEKGTGSVRAEPAVTPANKWSFAFTSPRGYGCRYEQRLGSTLPPDREPSPARSALERARGSIAVSRSWTLRAKDGPQSFIIWRSPSLVAVSGWTLRTKARRPPWRGLGPWV